MRAAQKCGGPARSRRLAVACSLVTFLLQRVAADLPAIVPEDWDLKSPWQDFVRHEVVLGEPPTLL